MGKTKKSNCRIFFRVVGLERERNPQKRQHLSFNAGLPVC